VPYLIAYVVEEDGLWVIAILHGRRGPVLMAAILHYRQ
jgi:cobalamin biosynthesis protein CbiG